MRIKILSLLFLIASTTTFAQFKVNSNGQVSIANISNSSTNCTLSIGDMTYYGAIHSKLTCRMEEDTQNAALFGVCSLTIPTNIIPRDNKGIGLLGYSACSTTNYGTVGSIHIEETGVGIYGSNKGMALPEFRTSSYAGYFDGATYINGRLTATEVVTPSDINLKENIQLLTSENTLEKILNMNVIKYNYKQKTIGDTDFLIDDKEQIAKAKTAIERQNQIEAEQIHFGLSAQELGEIYPELVRKDQDGYLGVNYLELVPILIRSIQELKQELDEVRGQSKDKVTRSGSFYDKDENLASSNENILYQNSPNPFKEKTIIRFKLAKDVQDASICFFDMNGRLLKKMPVSSGMESVSIGGYELGEGMFLYSLIVNGQEIDTKKMVITK